MESRPSLDALCRFPLAFDTATFRVGALAVGLLNFTTHGSAGSIGISSFLAF